MEMITEARDLSRLAEKIMKGRLLSRDNREVDNRGKIITLEL